MDKKNLPGVVFVVVLTGFLVVAVIFFVRKYEKESMPVPPAIQHPAPVLEKHQGPAPEEGQALPSEGNSQFPTENGKLLQ
jgi:hypothetical protein